MRRQQNVTFIVFVLLCGILLLTNLPSINGVKVSPPKINVDISNWGPKDTAYFKIKVQNPDARHTNVTVDIQNPAEGSKTENHSNIPDLSWITVEPKEMTVPPKSSRYFNCTLKIPNAEKQSYLDEKWEAWAYITEKTPNPAGNGIMININVAVKIFITTPSQAMIQFPLNLRYVFIILLLVPGIVMLFLFLKKKQKQRF